MDESEYYQAVRGQVVNAYAGCNCATVYNDDIKNIVPDLKNEFPEHHIFSRKVLSEIIPGNGRTLEELLYFLSVCKRMEMFAPVAGRDSSGKITSLLLPGDYEVHFNIEYRKEEHYESPEQMAHNLENYVMPATMALDDLLRNKFKLAHSHSLTPSGGHYLFRVARGSEAFNALAEIGCVNPVVLQEYAKRSVDPDIALAYSGLGLLSHFISEMIRANVHLEEERQVIYSNPFDIQLSIDDTCFGYLSVDRCMRIDVSLHRKREAILHRPGALAVIPIGFYDPEGPGKEITLGNLKEAMLAFWDLEKAAEISHRFTGHVPFANKGLLNVIDAYLKSDLRQYHLCALANVPQTDIRALFDAAQSGPLHGKTKYIIRDPTNLQRPSTAIKFIGDLKRHKWSAKQVMDFVASLFSRIDNFESSRRLRAEYWTLRYYPLCNEKEDDDEIENA